MCTKLRRSIPVTLVVWLAGCGASSERVGPSGEDAGPDADAGGEVDAGRPVEVLSLMFHVRNDTEHPVYAPIGESVHEIGIARNRGAGWETVFLHAPDPRASGEIECPGEADWCLCRPPYEFRSVRLIPPGEEISMGWAPNPPATSYNVVDEDFCADCRCYRPTPILPAPHSATRCVYPDYECTESDPCDVGSGVVFNPARGVGDERCYTSEFEIPPGRQEIVISITD